MHRALDEPVLRPMVGLSCLDSQLASKPHLCGRDKIDLGIRVESYGGQIGSSRLLMRRAMQRSTWQEHSAIHVG